MKNKTPIAVVGMAGMFPGAHDLPAFWHNIIHKIDSTSEVPKDRWIVEPEIMYHPTPEPDKAISKRACLIRQFEFDPEGLDLDRGILEALDPLYHIVLHTGREAFQGCVTSSIDKKRIGTILAAIVLPTDASSFIAREIFGRSFEEKLFGKSIGEFRPLTRNECLSSRVTSLPAAILARSLGLGGGSYTLDAACASSLYAVKLACDELISHRTDLMLAGGVSRPDNLYTQVGFSQLRALSPSGRCSPFDESADGLVVGEGAGILALKRLDDALRDGDEIFGLIRGMGLSNDLRGKLLAPDSEGQIRAMRRAYESAGWSPHDIDLIECHGAGTPVGDATELRSLRTLWGESGWSYEQCSIGSIKSMIGHLLTAAGAAGMIKTLIALKNKILPPSINFRKAPEGSPLLSSPFRVQTEAERWYRRDPKTPLHAAVSAFGFGGINAHLLFEEWDKNADSNVYPIPQSSIRIPQSSPPIAIIGMESQFGSLATLRAFQEAVFRGDSIIRKRPHDRWKGCDEVASRHLNGRLSDAGYMDEIMLNAGEFRIPPNEIPDILPQHLLMLKVAAGAMRDAGLPLREERPRMGSLIGIDFDFNATDFHLRWNLHNAVQKWKKHGSVDPEAMETDGWLESLSKSMGEPLTPTRTLGALGGVIASRVAREFRLGGPSFGVSCEEASGLKALEIGIRSLQQNEMDVVLVGAIDLPGDVRRVITNDKIKPYALTSGIRPFDAEADGGVPGEGAAAVVLKRLDQALKDGDRIYAVIKGIGNATGGGVDTNSPSREAYLLSMERAFQDAGLAASSIGYVEAHGSGDPIEDNIETKALHEFFSPQENPCAIGSVKSIIGHCGAAAGIASLVKTSLCLYHEIIPPLRNFIRSGNDVWETGTFHIPGFAQYWLRDRKFGPRRACIAAMTQDGNCMHAILEGFEYLSSDADALQSSLLEQVAQERKRPLGLKPYGLFIKDDAKKTLSIRIGGRTPSPALPKTEEGGQRAEDRATIADCGPPWRDLPAMQSNGDNISAAESTELSDVKAALGQGLRIAESTGIESGFDSSEIPYAKLIREMTENVETTADAHKAFLDFSDQLTRAYGKTLEFQTRLLEFGIRNEELKAVFPEGNKFPGISGIKTEGSPSIPGRHPGDKKPVYTRDQCLEFAIGSVQKVLGPEFAVVDTYKARVRLPDEPLMLVDRILSVEGEKASLSSGRVVTEHDVLPEAWYLDGDRAPVCISVEAGQADLFLCAYLGIDLFAKGERTYRLLDATVKFHRGLPRPGDVIQYEIEIEKFVRQGNTYLFFFNFKGTIGQSHLITMTNGCAGFFTEEEVRNSGGIILTEEDRKPINGKRDSNWKDLVPMRVEGYKEGAVEALRNGDLAGCFGPLFDGIKLADSLKLPGGRMRLIDRILLLDPNGGRYGLGVVRAEADIHPDDWFLTCHFMDDMVMPGTLMYECCAHALRVLIQRMGWVTDKPDVCYEPVIGVESVLKCRGPVTPKTRHVIYEVELKEIGYLPEPYVIADAHMYADGHRIVQFTDMCMKMTGVTRKEIESVWMDQRLEDRGQRTEDRIQKTEFRRQETESRTESPKIFVQQSVSEIKHLSSGFQHPASSTQYPVPSTQAPILFSREQILAFAVGNPSEAFGEPYRVFDRERFLARLPGPPYSFIDRVTRVEPEARVLKPDGWIEAEYDVSPDAWYFRANRMAVMPFCVLLEIGLQTCGFLAAYLGSVLKSEKDLKFRNLDGNAILHHEVIQKAETLTMRTRLKQVSSAADMIIEHFDMQILQNDSMIYEAETAFGFFTKEALSQQIGIRDASQLVYKPTSKEIESGASHRFEDVSPISPDDPSTDAAQPLAMPARALRMIDEIETYVPEGGPFGLGFIRGIKWVDPKEWFFKAHFYQDPVCPGSLGIESFLQLIKFAALARWGHLADSHRFAHITKEPHRWTYRGQIIQENKKIVIEAVVTRIEEKPVPMILADGFLKVDGLYIYKMENFGFQLVPI